MATHREVALRLVRRSHRGKGSAVAAGLTSANSELACFCDLDLATPLEDLARIIQANERAHIGDRVAWRCICPYHPSPETAAAKSGPRLQQGHSVLAYTGNR